MASQVLKSTASKNFDIGFKLTQSPHDNWQVWLFAISPMLKEEELLVYSESSTTFELVPTERASRAIMVNVDQDVLNLLVGSENASVMWKRLYAHFAGVSPSRKYLGIKQLTSFTCGNEGIQSDIIRIEGIQRRLEAAAGSGVLTISEIVVAMFLNALPIEFNPICSILQIETNLTLPQVKDRLLNEEAQMKNRSSSKRSFGMLADVGKCSHNRSPISCWSCHPDLDPRTKTCSDCSKYGHKDKSFRKCVKHKVNRDRKARGIPTPSPATPGVAAAVVYPGLIPKFGTDNDSWGQRQDARKLLGKDSEK